MLLNELNSKKQDIFSWLEIYKGKSCSIFANSLTRVIAITGYINIFAYSISYSSTTKAYSVVTKNNIISESNGYRVDAVNNGFNTTNFSSESDCVFIVLKM